MISLIVGCWMIQGWHQRQDHFRMAIAVGERVAGEVRKESWVRCYELVEERRLECTMEYVVILVWEVRP